MPNKAMGRATLDSLGKYRHKPASRYEFKYLLRPELAERVVDFLSSYLEMDEHCRQHDSDGYTVRSIYFDSPDFRCFHEKLSGQKYREKFRIRTYNDPGSAPLFLEHKIKDGLAYMKSKVALNDVTLEAVKRRDYDALNNVVLPREDSHILGRFFSHLYRRAYSPVALVTYNREAYVCPGQDTTRVTLDRNLRANKFPDLTDIYDECRSEQLLYKWIILEVKFAEVVPKWLARLSTLFQLRRQACSKYCTSVAHFLGETPDLKEGLAHVWSI